MIPSDHFTRFYNEVFKYLEARGEEFLRGYWRHISEHQERYVMDLFREQGFVGMKAYWDRIAIEENCDMECRVYPDRFEATMRKCPSLTKAMDNDAGAMLRYCDHCSGWINPIIRKLGYHPVYHVISRTEPRCNFYVYKDKDQAAAKAAELKGIVITD